ncbi:GH20537 [Drosophila grimshawi]|uniref:GH20537 n=2 Tax=Drosophila grimshawi TaxID=7222 RepID=B4J8M7_DROGR|nr:GH20537 [Drosophila grimshawi]
MDTEGSKQERYERLLAARPKETHPSKRGTIAKFGARLQLGDFAEIKVYNQAEFELLSGKLKWRLEHVRRTEDGESLEYFHPDVLSRIDRAKTYMLNMDEFLVRQEPYIHKIFAIFVSRTGGQEPHLCYARSLAKLRSWDEITEEFEWPLIGSEHIAKSLPNGEMDNTELETNLITSENIAKAMTYILTVIREKGLKNFVAIACDQNRLSLAAVTMLVEASGHVMLPCVFDTSDLQKSLRDMFCSACVRCSVRVSNELYLQSSYEEQLSRICNSNSTKNMNAVLLLMDYVNRLPQILLAMWHFEEHRDKPISLLGLNNKLVKIYGSHLRRELPPITFENCAAGSGLLQLLVFDALWHISPELEPEELHPR